MTDERTNWGPSEKLDAMAIDLASHVEGWMLPDVAQVCAALSAYAIKEMPIDNREKMLNDIFSFMRDIALSTAPSTETKQ